MNNLIPTTSITMTSLEISELVESEHKHVKRSMERLSERGLISLSPLGTVKIQRERRAENVEVYFVGKRDSYVVVAQLSPEFTARLVDRWQELEAAAANPAPFAIPQSLPEALRLAADLAEQKAALEAKIEADRPKVEFSEAVRRLDGSCLVREFAKVLGTGQNRFFKWLRDSGFLMANNEPYQDYLDRDIFVRIEGTPFTDSKGVSHPTFTTRITGKGQVFLEKKYRAVSTQATEKAAPALSLVKAVNS